MSLNVFKTSRKISRAELGIGLRMLIYEGVFAQIMNTFTGGAFLVAFALLLGASNFTIGLIAAVGPLTQVLQIPTISLVEKTGQRKLLVTTHAAVSRMFWFLAAAVPWIAGPGWQVGLFLLALIMYYAAGTVSNLTLAAWMRDLIPDKIRGRYVAKRMALMTLAGAGLSLLAGLGVDGYKKIGPEIEIYSLYFALGGCAGILGTYFVYRTPEPKLPPKPAQSLASTIQKPFQDANFRHLLFFLGSWNFSVNLVAPFFTVYMLKRLSLNMSWIIGLSVLSQMINVMFLRLWGVLADCYSNKSVLLVACTLFLGTTAAWPFTTMPGVYFLTIPVLIAIHALAGMSSAGIMLCTGNIALKLAPYGRSTAYLAVNALLSGIVASIASVLGGAAATWLENHRLSMTIRWFSIESLQWEIPALELAGLDFLFILSFLVGIYALHRLLAVHERGEVEPEVVLDSFGLEVRKVVANLSNIEGLLDLVYFPYARLREALQAGPPENNKTEKQKT